jgi:hypothetical protein
MGLSSKAGRFTGGGLLVAAVLLCLGAFLCFVPTELGVSKALRPAHSHPLDRGADEGYLAATQEEAEKADKAPVNADLLTMLVLAVSSYFGMSFGGMLTNTPRQGAWCSLGVVGEPLASACKELPFLGVFRL